MADPLNPEDTRRLQQALIRWGYEGKIDGDFGPASQSAMRAYQQARGRKPIGYPTTRDLAELGIRAKPKPNPLVSFVGQTIFNAVLGNLLKGTNMDFAKISKAIAAAISGAGIGGGSAVYTYIQIPPEQLAALPGWFAVGIPTLNAVIGAIAGFVIVYFAPANKPS